VVADIGGQNVGPLEVEDQEHVRAPEAEAPNRRDLGDHLVVVQLTQPVELQLPGLDVRGEIAHVLHLAPGEPDRAQLLRLDRQQLRRRGDAAVEARQQAVENGRRGLGRQLLADDRAQQHAVGVPARPATPPARERHLAGPLDDARHHRIGLGELLVRAARAHCRHGT
jgi:hypothetical protein